MTTTKEAFDRSMASYSAAMDELFDVSPEIRCRGSAGGMHIYIRSSYETHAPSAMGRAGEVLVRHANLFEYGRPKEMRGTETVWNSRFLTVDAYVVATWRYYRYECPRVELDDEGAVVKRTEARIVESTPQRITLKIRAKEWGLKDWRERYPEILSFCDECPESVRDHYRERVEKANALVGKYTEAVSTPRLVP